MRTTLDFDPRLLEDIVEATGEKSKSKAVNRALGDFLRRKAIDDLRAVAGKLELIDSRLDQRVADRRREGLLDKLRSR